MIDLDEIVKYSKGLKLLYVEDNKDAREMTTMILENFFDSIVVAVNGEDGYEKFKSNNIDLVITDINMPILNGLDMCSKIREIDSDVPLIVLSAHNEDNLFIKSIAIGVSGYLLKPIEHNQLSSLIYRVTQKYKYATQAKANQHLLKVYQKATDLSSIVSRTDLKGIITYVNDSFCEISGYTKDELIGKNHNIVRHPDNPQAIFKEIWESIKEKQEIWKGIVRNRAKNGKSYYVNSLIMPITDIHGNTTEYISLRNDITNIMNPQKQLTNELNDSSNPLLIYMKLGNFSDIEEFYDNSTIELIQDMTLLYLQNKFTQIYSFDKIYQLGNGEYALVLKASSYLKDEKFFIKKLKEYQELIKEDTITLPNIEYDISLLISFAYEKEKILESVKLGIKRLIKVKKTFILANSMATKEQAKARENMKTVFMIKNAINNSKIVSYFQPIIDNTTQEIVKYESLVRLINEEGKVLSPFFFLETAKKSNYYLNITNIVLEHSFTMLRNCHYDISINLSALDIEHKSMRERILKLLKENKEYANRVVFELLEDESVQNINTVKQFIIDVKEYGVKIAIDDFGAGYSNFERLLDYQPDILKIDGCLIRDIETSTYSLSVVKSIVTFAKEQKLQTIAEFIENEAIYKIIKELGVDFSQGYHFGKPEPLNIS